MLLIDALNVAYWCGSPPSLRLPLTLLDGALAAGHDAWLIFDASAPYRLSDDASEYAELLASTARVTVVASGRPADIALLKQARDTGARLISNDRYRDHRRRFRRLIDDPARLLGGSVGDDRVRVPALSLAAPLPATTALAWVALSNRLAAIRTAI